MKPGIPPTLVSSHLPPNLTELVFAAGAGEFLVGVSAYSDYPQAALDLPVVGDAFMIDQEQLAMLRPNLLLVWESGTPPHLIDELRDLGYGRGSAENESPRGCRHVTCKNRKPDRARNDGQTCGRRL